MPVTDHPIHPKTVLINPEYGCHNRKPFAKGYWTQTRVYHEDGTFHVEDVFIEHTLSTDCRYDMSLNDFRCANCNLRGSGEARTARIRAEATAKAA